MSCYRLPRTFKNAESHLSHCTQFKLPLTEDCCVLQANVWTEYISDEDTVEYMTFPRLAALSEAVWSLSANKNWADFKDRLPGFLDHLEAMGNKFRALT